MEAEPAKTLPTGPQWIYEILCGPPHKISQFRAGRLERSTCRRMRALMRISFLLPTGCVDPGSSLEEWIEQRRRLSELLKTATSMRPGGGYSLGLLPPTFTLRQVRFSVKRCLSADSGCASRCCLEVLELAINGCLSNAKHGSGLQAISLATVQSGLDKRSLHLRDRGKLIVGRRL